MEAQTAPSLGAIQLTQTQFYQAIKTLVLSLAGLNIFFVYIVLAEDAALFTEFSVKGLGLSFVPILLVALPLVLLKNEILNPKSEGQEQKEKELPQSSSSQGENLKISPQKGTSKDESFKSEARDEVPFEHRKFGSTDFNESIDSVSFLSESMVSTVRLDDTLIQTQGNQEGKEETVEFEPSPRIIEKNKTVEDREISEVAKKNDDDKESHSEGKKPLKMNQEVIIAPKNAATTNSRYAKEGDTSSVLIAEELTPRSHHSEDDDNDDDAGTNKSSLIGKVGESTESLVVIGDDQRDSIKKEVVSEVEADSKSGQEKEKPSEEEVVDSKDDEVAEVNTASEHVETENRDENGGEDKLSTIIEASDSSIATTANLKNSCASPQVGEDDSVPTTQESTAVKEEVSHQEIGEKDDEVSEGDQTFEASPEKVKRGFGNSHDGEQSVRRTLNPVEISAEGFFIEGNDWNASTASHRNFHLSQVDVSSIRDETSILQVDDSMLQQVQEVQDASESLDNSAVTTSSAATDTTTTSAAEEGSSSANDISAVGFFIDGNDWNATKRSDASSALSTESPEKTGQDMSFDRSSPVRSPEKKVLQDAQAVKLDDSSYFKSTPKLEKVDLAINYEKANDQLKLSVQVTNFSELDLHIRSQHQMPSVVFCAALDPEKQKVKLSSQPYVTAMTVGDDSFVPKNLISLANEATLNCWLAAYYLSDLFVIDLHGTENPTYSSLLKQFCGFYQTLNHPAKKSVMIVHDFELKSSRSVDNVLSLFKNSKLQKSGSADKGVIEFSCPEYSIYHVTSQAGYDQELKKLNEKWEQLNAEAASGVKDKMFDVKRHFKSAFDKAFETVWMTKNLPNGLKVSTSLNENQTKEFSATFDDSVKLLKASKLMVCSNNLILSCQSTTEKSVTLSLLNETSHNFTQLENVFKESESVKNMVVELGSKNTIARSATSLVDVFTDRNANLLNVVPDFDHHHFQSDDISSLVLLGTAHSISDCVTVLVDFNTLNNYGLSDELSFLLYEHYYLNAMFKPMLIIHDFTKPSYAEKSADDLKALFLKSAKKLSSRIHKLVGSSATAAKELEIQEIVGSAIFEEEFQIIHRLVTTQGDGRSSKEEIMEFNKMLFKKMLEGVEKQKRPSTAEFSVALRHGFYAGLSQVYCQSDPSALKSSISLQTVEISFPSTNCASLHYKSPPNSLLKANNFNDTFYSSIFQKSGSKSLREMQYAASAGGRVLDQSLNDESLSMDSSSRLESEESAAAVGEEEKDASNDSVDRSIFEESKSNPLDYDEGNNEKPKLLLSMNEDLNESGSGVNNDSSVASVNKTDVCFEHLPKLAVINSQEEFSESFNNLLLNNDILLGYFSRELPDYALGKFGEIFKELPFIRIVFINSSVCEDECRKEIWQSPKYQEIRENFSQLKDLVGGEFSERAVMAVLEKAKSVQVAADFIFGLSPEKVEKLGKMKVANEMLLSENKIENVWIVYKSCEPVKIVQNSDLQSIIREIQDVMDAQEWFFDLISPFGCVKGLLQDIFR